MYLQTKYINFCLFFPHMEDIWFNTSSWSPHSVVDIHLHWSTVEAEGYDRPLLAWNVIAQQCK